MEPIDTMTTAQAIAKHGNDVNNRTTSQRCPHCKEMIFRDDFVDEPEPEGLTCPTCETRVINKFYSTTEKPYTAKQVEYLNQRYHANEKLLEALQVLEKLYNEMWQGHVVPVGDAVKASDKVQAELVALRKIFMDSGL